MMEMKFNFNAIVEKYSSNLSDVSNILRYLHTYPELLGKIEIEHLINPDSVRKHLETWLKLYSNYENEIDIDFFKPYWLPIETNSYGLFIDFSVKNYPIFETKYFFYEPCRWYKKYILKDLSQFLVDIDKSDFKIENHLKQLDNERWSKIEDFFNERDELGIAGKLELDSINKDCIFLTINDVFLSEVSIESYSSYYIFKDNSVTFERVNSLIVGLLPYDYEITLENFSSLNNRKNNICNKVKNIKALIYLLQSSGMLQIDSYSFTFDSDTECRADFKDNTFKIVHKDKEFLKDLIDKYETFKKS